MENISKLKTWQRGRDFLGVKYPIISGAMTWISDSRLVKAVSKAGGFGVLAAGNMPSGLLKSEISELKKSINTGYGVNLITIAPNYREHLELVADLKVPYVVFAGSFPRKEEIDIVKNTGAKTLCFASTESIAKRMINYGTDALILEGCEAGGHIGYVSTTVLIQQVLYKFDSIPVFIAGGIGTGRMVADLFVMGASGVQMGTVFAMSEESPAHDDFKERFRKARSREAFATPQYHSSLPVVSVRALKNKGMDKFGELQLDLIKKLEKNEISRIEAQYKVEEFWIGALRMAVQEGDVSEGSLMSGQSVGLVNEIKSVKSIIEEMVEEADKEIIRIKGLF